MFMGFLVEAQMVKFKSRLGAVTWQSFVLKWGSTSSKVWQPTPNKELIIKYKALL